MRDMQRLPVRLSGLDQMAARFIPQRARPSYRVTGLWY